jgi:hypothetical protein
MQNLANMRNGIVHAAESEEVEAEILAAFVQHADGLKDLGRDRAEFWGGQLAVADALLADASDKVAHQVDVKIAAARASYEREYGDLPPDQALLRENCSWLCQAADRHTRRR